MKGEPKWMCIDTETTGLDWTTDILHGIGVGYEEDHAEYYSVHNLPTKVKEHLANPKIAKIGHNLHAFDAKFIRKAGFDIQGNFHDTMVLAHLIDDMSPLGLKYLSDKYIGMESLDNKRRLDKYITDQGAGNIAGLCAKDLADPEHPHEEIIAEYCKEDVNNTTKLFFLFMANLKEQDLLLKSIKWGLKKTPLDYYKEEAMPLEKVLFEIEYRGIRVDMGAIVGIRDSALKRMAEIDKKLTKAFRNRIPKLEQELYEKAVVKVVTEKAKKRLKAGEGKLKFTWSNNNHVGDLLYKYCDLPQELVFKTDKGKYKTDKAAIEMIASGLPNGSPLPALLKLFSEYKLQGKIATTYTGDSSKGILSGVRTVDGISRIYPSYRQTTATGRLACRGPNMQNLKRDSEVKRFFIPDQEDEVFDDADYSQIELRTGAHLSGEPGLCEAYNNGLDVHLRTASRLFGRKITKADDMERQAGKRTNFLTIFDGKAFRLQQALKADTGRDFTLSECGEFIRLWFEAYPEFRAYLDSQKEFFIKHKFCISETGRIRHLPEIVLGKHLHWVNNPDEPGRRMPRYKGSKVNREYIIQYVLKKNRKLHAHNVTDDMIGWAAYKLYNHAIKAGYNQPIQGLAASMTKRAMIALHKVGRVISNQVHDSLIVSRKRSDVELRKQLIITMETVYPLSIPVVADCKTIKTFHPSDKIED